MIDELDQRREIENFYREMHGKLLAYASSVLKDEHHAEEAVQDTFRIACEKVDVFLGSKNPSGWLLITLKNVLRNMKKERAKLNMLVVTSISLDEGLQAQKASAADDGVEHLLVDTFYSGMIPEDDFRLLKRVAIDKYTMLEAAEEFGLNVEQCKKRVQRAKVKLKKELDKIL